MAQKRKTGSRRQPSAVIESDRPLSEFTVEREVCGQRQPRSGAVCFLEPGHGGDHRNAAGGQWTDECAWQDYVL